MPSVEFILFALRPRRRRPVPYPGDADRRRRGDRHRRLQGALVAVQDRRRPGRPRPAPAARVGDPGEPAAAPARLRPAGRPVREEQGARGPAEPTCPTTGRARFLLLVLVFVLSSFLDNIAAAMIGGAMAHTVFRGKVHIGYLAAIVAASNGGGAGSVVGDTTTTMMWIAGRQSAPRAGGLHRLRRRPVRVRHPGGAHPAALLADRQGRRPEARIDGASVAIVAFVLIAAIVVNVTMNTRFAEMSDRFPVPRRGGLPGDRRLRAAARAGLVAAAGRLQGLGLPALAGAVRLDDAGRAAARRVVADRARPGLSLLGVRQHPAHRAGAEAGRLRLGLPRLRRRLRRLDDLVRLLGRRGAVEHVPRRPARSGGGCATAGPSPSATSSASS